MACSLEVSMPAHPTIHPNQIHSGPNAIFDSNSPFLELIIVVDEVSLRNKSYKLHRIELELRPFLPVRLQAPLESRVGNVAG
jgi:hypothetical protein